jgi:hypothetical protein
VTLQKRENSESWIVGLLEECLSQSRELPDAEVVEQLAEEWRPYFVMGSELIQ